MDFKSLISQLDQLNEATEKTKTGIKHTAEPGGYGRKDDEDDEGNKVKDKAAEKKGRGRPKKATSTSGEDKKYDFSAFGVTKGKDVKLPKYDKKKTKKHSIKEYLDQMYAPLNEEGITVKPMPGASQIIGANGKPMGTADAATANMIKQASEKGTLKFGGDEEMQEGDIGKHNNATTGFDALVRKLTPKYGKEAATKIAGSQLKKIKEADMPPRDALASPLTLEAKKPDANKNGIPDYAEDGKGKNDLKKKKVKESMNENLLAARLKGKHDGIKGHSHCGKNYQDMEEARNYHEGYKEGLDECYGQMPIQGYVGETESGADVVNTMASYGAEEGELAEADIEESPFSWAAKNTPKGEKFKLGGKEFVKNDAFAFESLEKQLNALLESKEDVAEGMTVSISKGQQGSPDSVSINAQDAEADELLSFVKQAGLGIFGGDDASGQEPMTVDHGDEPAEIGAGGDAIEVVGDHDGMMSLMKKLSGIGGGEESHEEEACEACGESACGCDHGKEMVDEVESEDQMTYQMAEDNPPDSGAAEEEEEIQDTAQANAAGAAYNPSNDIDEGADGGEASDAGNIGVEAGDADEEMKADMNEEDEKQKDGLEESSFANLYRKLAMLSEESTAEKDDKAEKAGKKVAKDIEYDEGHKGKDDDKAEKAGKEVKKDIEYDDKKDKKEKKLDEWANDAGKNGTDTTFETDIDFMMNVISGGLNKRKQTGQTTIPVVASQLGRQVSHNTTDINESTDTVSDWKKLAGLK